MTASISQYRATAGKLRAAAFLASTSAAAIHLGAAPAHLAEYVPAGVFMLASGTFQLVWAFAVASKRHGARLIETGVWINIGIVALWTVSRTAGLPVGSEPWVAEHIHGPDLLATALEILLVGAGWSLVDPFLPRPARTVLALATAGALLSLVVTGDDPTRERAVAALTFLFAGCVRVAVRARTTQHRRNHARTADFARLDIARVPHAGAAFGARG